MDVTTKPKKWGNSIGIIIPKEVIDAEQITLNDELIVHVEKKKNKEKLELLKEGYIEMYNDSIKINKEWSKADPKWP